MNKTLTIGIADGGDVISTAFPITGEEKLDAEITVPGSTTDMQVEMQFGKDRLKCIEILSDQTVTLETNATDHTGGDQFTITANLPFFWFTGSGITNPFSADVTVFYFTKAGAGSANVKIRGLKDATP